MPIVVTDCITGQTTIVEPTAEQIAAQTIAREAAVAAEAQSANRRTIEQAATDALAANRAFLALASPTNAQTLAQVKALTRQNQALIRIVLNRLDGTD